MTYDRSYRLSAALIVTFSLTACGPDSTLVTPDTGLRLQPKASASSASPSSSPSAQTHLTPTSTPAPTPTAVKTVPIPKHLNIVATYIAPQNSGYQSGPSPIADQSGEKAKQEALREAENYIKGLIVDGNQPVYKKTETQSKLAEDIRAYVKTGTPFIHLYSSQGSQDIIHYGRAELIYYDFDKKMVELLGQRPVSSVLVPAIYELQQVRSVADIQPHVFIDELTVSGEGYGSPTLPGDYAGAYTEAIKDARMNLLEKFGAHTLGTTRDVPFNVKYFMTKYPPLKERVDAFLATAQVDGEVDYLENFPPTRADLRLKLTGVDGFLREFIQAWLALRTANVNQEGVAPVRIIISNPDNNKLLEADLDNDGIAMSKVMYANEAALKAGDFEGFKATLLPDSELYKQVETIFQKWKDTKTHYTIFSLKRISMNIAGDDAILSVSRSKPATVEYDPIVDSYRNISGTVDYTPEYSLRKIGNEWKIYSMPEPS